MEVKQLLLLALDVFHSTNKLNPVNVQSLFEKNANSKKLKFKKVPTGNSVTLRE